LQKLDGATEQVELLEKEVDSLRMQAQKFKGLAACSLFESQQQQLSSTSSVKKLSSACAQLFLHSACVQTRHDALCKQLVKYQQQKREFEQQRVSRVLC
jgi:hypothetical protein